MDRPWAGLSRALESDIRTAWEGVKDAAKPRIHTFLGTSPSHLAMLRIDKAEGLQRIRDAVTLAKSLCDDVEFSPHGRRAHRHRIPDSSLRRGRRNAARPR